MFTEEMLRKPAVRVGRLLLGASLGVTDVVQPTGPAVEANYLHYMDFWPARRAAVRMIPNGIDIPRFSGEETRDLRSELGLSSRDLLIGFVGRFMAIKGFAVLLAAIEQMVSDKRLQDRNPVVVAVGSGGFLREEKAQIKAKGLEGHVRFLPHTDQVAETLRGLDVLVIPSISEASPILPMEALVSGVPVVASDCPGLRATLEGTPAELFPNRDSRALADILLSHAGSSRRDSAARFRPAAGHRFDSRMTALQVRDVLQELAISSRNYRADIRNARK